ncbi:MAG: polyphosphate kinase 1 [bacterium]
MLFTKKFLQHYYKPENFFNRDLSWVEFNRKVLEEAFNPKLPLLDKVKFISIFFSNLDEFYMIRVSGLKEQISANIIEPTIDGLTPIEALQMIEKTVKDMVNKVYNYWNNVLIPELKKNNIIFLSNKDLNAEEKEQLNNYFYKEIYPILTPLAFDPGRPFPYISNLSISYAILVQNKSGERHFARVKIPSLIARLLKLDNIVKTKNGCKNTPAAKFIWIGELIRDNLHTLFPGFEVLQAHRFRIIRDTDLEIQEDEADDLLQVIEENIKQRKFGSVVRLEVEKDMPDFMIDTLTENLQITNREVHIIDGVLGLSDVIGLYDLPMFHLKEKAFHPVVTKEFEDENIFSIIKQRDVFFHHPYDSFSPVVDFIKTASKDADVLAIKQTLYRVGTNSPVVRALIEAAERKKQVAVLVELKARFDEENNIFWAKELEKAGVHVVYGLVGLKTHSKMTLVVRREQDGVQRYVHLGSGNYNPATAKIYTDIGLFTCDPDICADVSEVFNYLTGYSAQQEFRKLLVAPLNIRTNLIQMVEKEIYNVNKGGKGHIIMKMNSLVDPSFIAALYAASQRGVKVDLIIRGICCLVPQVPGLSENIRVISIVGRFLEHSRLFYFYNNGQEDILSGSADIMPRNLDRRVEVLFPIRNNDFKQTIINRILLKALKDNIKAWVLLPTGKYVINHPVFNEESLSLQDFLITQATNDPVKTIQRETGKK